MVEGTQKTLSEAPRAPHFLAASSGARRLTALCPAQNSWEGYDPHPALHGVREQEASWRKDLLVLLLDVARDLPENLQKRGG